MLIIDIVDAIIIVDAPTVTLIIIIIIISIRIPLADAAPPVRRSTFNCNIKQLLCLQWNFQLHIILQLHSQQFHLFAPPICSAFLGRRRRRPAPID